MAGKLLTKQELADALGIKQLLTIEKWVQEGMPKYKLGKPIRFDLDEVKTWFKEREAKNARGTEIK